MFCPKATHENIIFCSFGFWWAQTNKHKHEIIIMIMAANMWAAFCSCHLFATIQMLKRLSTRFYLRKIFISIHFGHIFFFSFEKSFALLRARTLWSRFLCFQAFFARISNSIRLELFSWSFPSLLRTHLNWYMFEVNLMLPNRLADTR